jgi:hypothetical protein
MAGVPGFEKVATGLMEQTVKSRLLAGRVYPGDRRLDRRGELFAAGAEVAMCVCSSESCRARVALDAWAARDKSSLILQMRKILRS